MGEKIANGVSSSKVSGPEYHPSQTGHSLQLHLEHVSTAKYLGLTITHDIWWNQHITNIAHKATRALGFLCHNLQLHNPQLKSTAYQTLVRPSLEYAPTVWHPYIKGNIEKLEMVQRKAARFTLSRYRNKSSLTDMLNKLGWPSLEKRHEKQQLFILYKISLVAVNGDRYLTPAKRPTRHNNTQAYLIPQSTTDYHKYSFFPRTACQLNGLPHSTVCAPRWMPSATGYGHRCRETRYLHCTQHLHPTLLHL